MKKTVLVFFFMFCIAGALQAKPLNTEGFDMYKNGFKVDLVSVGYLSPQVVWEHYTDTRFTFGVSAQTHFVNRSTFVRSLTEGQEVPTTVKLDGITYDLDWSGHTSKWYADVEMEDGKHEVKWDRKYVGVMVCPEGRIYLGRRPHRGFYGVLRTDIGIFRETFVVSRTKLTYAQEDAIIQQRKDEAQAAGQDPNSVSKTIEDRWQRAGYEKGELFCALGGGAGFGYQGWFKKNSHWGFDVNTFLKKDFKFSEDENQWEWLWGVGSFFDLNMSLIYRF